MVFAVWWYQAEINNGGHAQFFGNSTGIVWEDALKGLGLMGLRENQAILQEAVGRLGGAPAKERQKRLDQLDLFEPTFDDLDQRFDVLMLNNTLYDGINRYIQEHRASFHFDGTIESTWQAESVMESRTGREHPQKETPFCQRAFALMNSMV